MGKLGRKAGSGGLMLAAVAALWEDIKSWATGNALENAWRSVMAVEWQGIPWNIVLGVTLAVASITVLTWPWLVRICANARAAILGEAPIIAVHEKMDANMSEMKVISDILAAISAYSNEQETRINKSITDFTTKIEKLNNDMAPIIQIYRKEERNIIADEIEVSMANLLDTFEKQQISSDIANTVIGHNAHRWDQIGLGDQMRVAREKAIQTVSNDIRLCSRTTDEDKEKWRSDDEKKGWKIMEAIADAYVKVLRT